MDLGHDDLSGTPCPFHPRPFMFRGYSCLKRKLLDVNYHGQLVDASIVDGDLVSGRLCWYRQPLLGMVQFICVKLNHVEPTQPEYGTTSKKMLWLSSRRGGSSVFCAAPCVPSQHESVIKSLLVLVGLCHDRNFGFAVWLCRQFCHDWARVFGRVVESRRNEPKDDEVMA